MGRPAIPMVGKTFGTLRVLRRVTSRPKDLCFEAECTVCGRVSIRLGGNIRRAGRSGTSGCECGSKAKTHGQSSHPGFKTWEGMMARCYSPKHQAFKSYGGRGVTVCDEWRRDPSVFLKWIEDQGWHPGLQVDREDNNAGYCPHNCRVVTQIVNMNNRRVNRRISVGGHEMTVAEAARLFGIGKTTIKERLNRGWSDADAVRPVSHVS